MAEWRGSEQRPLQWPGLPDKGHPKPTARDDTVTSLFHLQIDTGALTVKPEQARESKDP